MLVIKAPEAHFYKRKFVAYKKAITFIPDKGVYRCLYLELQRHACSGGLNIKPNAKPVKQ